MRLRLKIATVAVAAEGDRRTASIVPKGAIVQLRAAAPNQDGMISVVWNDRDYTMFAVDVAERGENETPQGVRC